MDSQKVDVVVHTENDTVVLDEVKEQDDHGQYTGHTKWFNDKLGYGFITICDGDDKGKDIFVHHSGIRPLNSNYKTLRKGEYIQFNIINGMNGLQAVDVTGIKGGPLMCDYVTSKRQETGWQTVARRALPRVMGGQSVSPVSSTRNRRPTNVVRPNKNVNKYNKATRSQSP